MPEVKFARKTAVTREAIDMMQPMIDGDEGLYRSLTQATNRDLSPITQERMQEIALFLFRVNPLAHRILKLSSSFIASGNVNFKAEDDSVQKILDDHWNHPVNDWDNSFYQKLLELSLYGEQIITTAVTSKGEVY